MITCPACQHENVDGTQFCEMCGEELPSATAAASSEEMIKCPQCGAENPADNLACEACGADLHPSSSAPAPVITAPVSPIDAPMDTTAQTAPLSSLDLPAGFSPAADPLDLTEDDLKKPSDMTPMAPAGAPTGAPQAAPQSAGNLAPGNVKLVVEQGQSVGAQFVLGDAEMLVGREDEDADIYPDIDLSDQDAGYVHRQHAKINFEDGNLAVTHLGGSNKTRINNKPIPDNEPSPLKLGDKVSFGKVVLRLCAGVMSDFLVHVSA